MIRSQEYALFSDLDPCPIKFLVARLYPVECFCYKCRDCSAECRKINLVFFNLKRSMSKGEPVFFLVQKFSSDIRMQPYQIARKFLILPHKFSLQPLFNTVSHKIDLKQLGTLNFPRNSPNFYFVGTIVPTQGSTVAQLQNEGKQQALP